MPVTGGTAVILLSYRRPTMTGDAIKRLVEMSCGLPILVTVDLPSGDAPREDWALSSETFRTARDVAGGRPSIAVFQPTVGRGIISHVFLAAERAKELFGASSFILLEEDQILDLRGMNFLMKELSKSSDVPRIATAYTSRNHDGPIQPRLSLFPELWGVGVSAETLRRARILSSGNTSWSWRRVLATVVKTTGPSAVSAISARYLHRTFLAAQSSSNHLDGLIHAVSVLSESFAVVPSRSLLADIGGGEGSYSTRGDAPSHVSPGCHVLPREGTFCLPCERSRQMEVLKSYQSRLVHRIPQRRSCGAQKISILP